MEWHGAWRVAWAWRYRAYIEWLGAWRYHAYAEWRGAIMHIKSGMALSCIHCVLLASIIHHA